MNIDLNKNWKLSSSDNFFSCDATPNSSNYLDLKNARKIPDPFYGQNEKDLLYVAEKDYIYTNNFNIKKDVLKYDRLDLVFDYIDTFSEIYLNDTLILKTSNCFLSYRINVKPYLKEGENSVKVIIFSPLNYAREKQAKHPLPNFSAGIDGFNYARKPSCHFGWDWGPILPVSGIGNVKIECLDKNTINDIYTLQEHKDNIVYLTIFAETQLLCDSEIIVAEVFSPASEMLISKEMILKDGKYYAKVQIENPLLWYPSGVFDKCQKPLYKVKVSLRGEKESSEKTVKIGLRSIQLNTASDKYGQDFCFIVNGERIFAKGANWIPPDSLKRIDELETERLIKIMADSNFNMVRVWGGGFIESDCFYDLCDRYGILVWQDFPYACAPYPFFDESFLHEALYEAEQCIKRIRNHASLSLLCGNNEIESMTMAWGTKRYLVKSSEKFFNYLLKETVERLAENTSYRPSSPAGDGYLKNINSDEVGDTHIWGVWHGMMNFEYFLKRNTRFCSEFGFESMPSKQAVLSITDKIKDFKDPDMLSHQKCPSGNNRMLYYMAKNYRIPSNPEHLIYLSQLTQANSIKVAVEHWRRNLSLCNGSLYWQFNDCWPVSSWSSLDYLGNYKALQYFAKDFYAPLNLSITNRGEVYISNDSAKAYIFTVSYKLILTNGEIISEESNEFSIEKYSVKRFYDVKIPKNLKNQAVLFAYLYDENGALVTTDSKIFVPDRMLLIKQPKINLILNKNEIIIGSDAYVRQLMLTKSGVHFEKNFFDMEANKDYVIPFRGEINSVSEIELTSLNDIKNKYPRIVEKLLQFKICLEPRNFGGIILYRVTQK